MKQFGAFPFWQNQKCKVAIALELVLHPLGRDKERFISSYRDALIKKSTCLFGQEVESNNTRGIAAHQKRKESNRLSRTYFEFPDDPVIGPSYLLGSFFCFFVPLESPFAFLDSLLLFCCFDMILPQLGFLAAICHQQGR